MAGQHAILSPSGFHALMLCPAKPAMERGRPDDASEYADEGTAAHYLAAEHLRGGMEILVGDCVAVAPNGDCSWLDGHPGKHADAAYRYFNVDADFVAAVQVYIDLVRSRIAMYEGLGARVELHVEQPVPIGHITGEEDAEGTADTVIIAVFPEQPALIEVIDLKFGRGVEVSAHDNSQLKLYGLGAAEKFALLYDFGSVSTLICQPRVSTAPSEKGYTLSELQSWARNIATPAAALAMRIYRGELPAPEHCDPHEDACCFCRAKGDCQALASKVQKAMGLEFTDLTTADATEGEAIVQASVATASAAGELGARMDAVPLVEMWCKAIRAKAESVLLAGGTVEGYKLVAGKKGARAWADEAEVEKQLKAMRLKKQQMYDFSLISPTTAEKLLKPTPKRWAKLQAHIKQADGKPSVAPLSDKRPALEVKPVESEFTPIPDEASATADDLV